ncbi:MAG: hypothetical protein V4671_15825 [Armatimonadota bacterium]
MFASSTPSTSVAEVTRSSDTTPPARRPRPYIPAASGHFAYAILVTRPGGDKYTHEEACALLGLRPDTVKRWRSQLIAAGREYFGDFFGPDPPYELCARFAIDPRQAEQDLRSLFGGN